MNFSKFASYLQRLETISSRLKMTQILAELFQKLDTDEIEVASYLMQGRLVPLYKKMEFNLSVKMMIRALAKIDSSDKGKHRHSTTTNLFGETDSSAQEDQVKKRYKKLGDLGLVAEELQTKSSCSLDIVEVFESLQKIATDSGQGSQDRKVLGLVALLNQLDKVSAKFVVRIVIGKLRLGFSTMTMIDALSWAVKGDKSESKFLEETYNKKADVGKLAKNYLSLKRKSQTDRFKTLNRLYSIEVGIPVVPALCQRLNTSKEVVEKMSTVIAEPKYDGMRIQLHFKKRVHQDEQPVNLFTRNLDNVTHMFPELVTAAQQLDCQSALLDGEMIGYDKKTHKLLPFQQTITRRRKHGVSQKQKDVPVKLFAFDILALNGKSLLNTPLRKRKDFLKQVIGRNKVIVNAPFKIFTDPQKLKTFHQAQLDAGMEGVVSKQVDSIYQSGRKGWSWVKTKESEGTSGKLADTLDVVVMGYYAGRGKRTSFGLGAILVGIVTQEKVLSIAKIGTGLSDEQLKQMKTKLDAIKVKNKPSQYQKVAKTLVPDVWVDPQLVIEVAADEITKSPTHAAGVALRFPRMTQVRSDKSWAQATTLEEVANL